MGERHPVEEADIRVTEALADTRRSPAVRVLGWVSEVADQPPTRALLAATLLAGAARRDARLVRAAVRAGLAHTLATGIKSAVKARVDRTRPDHALETRYRLEVSGAADASERHELSSFPSGHTAGALSVARALGRDYPRARGPALAAAAGVAAVQVPRAKHFVSDVAAGALIGWAADLAASAALDGAERWLADYLSRHPGLVPGSTAVLTGRFRGPHNGGPRNKSGVTEGVN